MALRDGETLTAQGQGLLPGPLVRIAARLLGERLLELGLPRLPLLERVIRTRPLMARRCPRGHAYRVSAASMSPGAPELEL